MTEPSATLHLVVRFATTPDTRDAVISALRDCIAPTRREAGCIAYELHEGVAPATDMFLTEAWASEEALDVHFRTTHFLALKNALDTALDGGMSGGATIWRMHASASTS